MANETKKNIVENNTIGDIGAGVTIGDNNTINQYTSLKSLTEAQKDRLELLEGLRERYEERLSKKMEYENNLFIAFEPQYTKIGTSTSYQNTILNHYKEGEQTDFDTLYQAFIKKHRSLLIIGEPGAGKTVLLLHIALELLKNSFQDEQYPIPVILDLATWRDEKQDFDTWLEQNLVFTAGRSGVSKAVAKELVRGKKGDKPNQRNLIVLLDGLDEIPEDDRASCVLAIKSYFKGQENNNPHHYPIGIICCRKQEYLHLEANLPIQAISEIIPLKLERVINELEKKNITASKILLTIIQEHQVEITKEKLLTTVFEVNLALNLAESHLLDDFRIDKLQTQNLTDAYIQQEIQKVKNYQPQNTRHYLGFLAQKMQENRKGITFELVDMQPDWLERRILFAITVGLFIGSILGLFASFSGAYIFGYVFGLSSGFSIIFFVWIANTIRFDEIREFSIKRLNWGNFVEKFYFGLFIGTFLGCFCGFLVGIFYDSSIGVFYGFLAGNSALTYYLFVEVLLAKKRYIKIITPYKRLFAPSFFDFLAFFSLILIFFPKNLNQPNVFNLQVFNWQMILLTSCLLTVLVSPLFNHLILRLLLLQEKKFPLRLVTFLNKISQTGLMEKDGGQWRFRHQLIQDRLAGKEIRQNT